MSAKAVTCFFMVSRLFRPLGQPSATLLALLPLVFCQADNIAGKITDNSGGFAQFTYTAYDHQDAAGAGEGEMDCGSSSLAAGIGSRLYPTRRSLRRIPCAN